MNAAYSYVGAYDTVKSTEAYDIISPSKSPDYNFIVYKKNFNYDTKLIVPSKIDKYEIKGVMSEYNFNNLDIEEIIFEEGIEQIVGAAFSECENIKHISFPNTIKYVQNYCFYKTEWANNIPIYAPFYINNILFKSGQADYIDIKKNTVSIGDRAFTGNNCIKTVVIPDSVNTINTFAFYDCNNLQKIVFPKELLKLPAHCLSYCRNLQSVNIPSQVTVIPEGFAYHCTNLKKIEINDGITDICKNAFSCCENLSTIKFPNSLKKIGVTAFNSCNSITELELPNTLKCVSNGAFRNSKSLKKVNIESKNIKRGTSLFKDCINLSEVTLNNEITEIPKRCFQGCKSLKEINLFDNIEYIGGYTFAGTSIENIKLPLKLNNISVGLFKDCKLLKHVELPNGLKMISSEAFKNCKNLNSIIIPDSVKIIVFNAFDNCPNLKEIVIPNGCDILNRTRKKNHNLNIIYNGTEKEYNSIPNKAIYSVESKDILYKPDIDEFNRLITSHNSEGLEVFSSKVSNTMRKYMNEKITEKIYQSNDLNEKLELANFQNIITVCNEIASELEDMNR